MRRSVLVLVLLLLPGVALAQEHTRQACVDGTDCYCDCVEDTSDAAAPSPPDANFATDFCKAENIPIDPLVLVCEDFENPGFENPASGGTTPKYEDNPWKALYGGGTTPCAPEKVTSGPAVFEGPTQMCKNILQSPRPDCMKLENGGLRPNSVVTPNGTFSNYEYSAGNDDLDTSGGHPTLNGEWDGCQSLYFTVKAHNPNGRGGSIAQIKSGNLRQTNTITMTMMKKYSSNHWIGAQGSLPCPACGNIKGDRYDIMTNSSHGTFTTPLGGSHQVKELDDPFEADCVRGSTDPAFGYPAGDKFPFSSLIRPNIGVEEGGIDGRGICCGDDSCFSAPNGPSGPRIGIEYHDNDLKPVRKIAPPKSLWNPRVAGGVPMSIIDPNDATADQDGRDEWLCLQWSIRNQGSSNMSYWQWVNNVPIVRMENIPDSSGRPYGASIEWLNLWAPGAEDDQKPWNDTGVDYVEVRDNYHLTESPTPATCAAVGFDGLPPAPSQDPPSVPDPTSVTGATITGGSFP